MVPQNACEHAQIVFVTVVFSLSPCAMNQTQPSIFDFNQLFVLITTDSRYVSHSHLCSKLQELHRDGIQRARNMLHKQKEITVCVSDIKRRILLRSLTAKFIAITFRNFQNTEGNTSVCWWLARHTTEISDVSTS